MLLAVIGYKLFSSNYTIEKKPWISKMMEREGVKNRDKCTEWLFGSDGGNPFGHHKDWNRRHFDIFIVNENELQKPIWIRWAKECVKRGL